MKRARSAGAAVLMAMLTVAFVATIAAAALWQQWRGIEVETAERARVQSAWILTGALDWARLLLREDQTGASAGGADHLGEPWAVPLQEARLSSFLAADRNNTSTDFGPEVMDAFLSGQIVDLQSLMNVNNLVNDTGQVSDDDVKAFERLFALLNLPANELTKLVENLRFSIAAGQVTPSPMQAPLRPQRVTDLVWLGLSAQTVAVLEPYVTLLPGRRAVNANTAAAEVIAAAGDIDLSDAQRLVQVRQAAYFKTVSDIQQHLAPGEQLPDNALTYRSDFFEVRARLRLDKLVVEERSVLRRDLTPQSQGPSISVLRRERGAVDPTTMARLAMAGQR
ncbi:type II secretion system minor pseudopilin GspK [Ramlibacter sp. PS4R-6]|uniref:type II secretion system minor pseudopilin GspK n=1 Tax=Ramlibacter sp. PS4R-6 TaxID=3133438 RepID=UPI0030988E19